VVFWFFRVRVIPCVRVRGFPFWSRMRVSFNVPVNVVVFCMLFLLLFGSVSAVVEEWTDCINSFCESICHYACGSFRAEVFD